MTSKYEIPCRGVIANGRVIAEQVLGGYLVDVRVASIGGTEGALQTLDVFPCCTNEDVHIFGGTDEPVDAHRGCANQYVLETLGGESSQGTQHLVAIHRFSVTRPGWSCYARGYDSPS